MYSHRSLKIVTYATRTPLSTRSNKHTRYPRPHGEGLIGSPLGLVPTLGDPFTFPVRVSVPYPSDSWKGFGKVHEQKPLASREWRDPRARNLRHRPVASASTTNCGWLPSASVMTWARVATSRS